MAKKKAAKSTGSAGSTDSTDRDLKANEVSVGVEGQTGDISVTEDSDLTGGVLYQEDATGGGMHIGEEPLDEISIEGDMGTDSPEEYAEIDKGEELWSGGEGES